MNDLLAAIDAAVAARGGIGVRPAVAADETFFEAIFVEVRAPEFARLPPQTVAPLLAMQYRARALDYNRRWPQRDRGLVSRSGEPVGRIDVAWSAIDADPAGSVDERPNGRPSPGDVHLVDIALAEAARGQGVGTEVLSALIAAAGAAGGRRVTLSVRQSNTGGRRLYRRLGFTECALSDDGLIVAMAFDFS